jgi:predicted DNA-binding protein (UPF0251 family)
MPADVKLLDKPLISVPRAVEAFNLVKNGMTPSEAADKMGITKGTLETYLYYACTPGAYEKKIAQQKTPEGRAVRRKALREWERRNPEKAKVRRREASLRYQRAHPEKMRQYRYRSSINKYLENLSPDAIEILDNILSGNEAP